MVVPRAYNGLKIGRRARTRFCDKSPVPLLPDIMTLYEQIKRKTGTITKTLKN